MAGRAARPCQASKQAANKRATSSQATRRRKAERRKRATVARCRKAVPQQRSVIQTDSSIQAEVLYVFRCGREDDASGDEQQAKTCQYLSHVPEFSFVHSTATTISTMSRRTAESAAASASTTAPLTTMASAIFFGAIFFATAALLVRSLSKGDRRPIQQAANPRSAPLDLTSLPSVYALFYHSSVLGLILLYAYLCEYHPPYPHGTKSYDRDDFFFLTALLILASIFTLTKNDPKQQQPDHDHDEQSRKDGVQAVKPANEKTEILNRDQTEEWKGWMQFMFLLYHYQHAEEVYNAIRVMITCYVWMTGTAAVRVCECRASSLFIMMIEESDSSMFQPATHNTQLPPLIFIQYHSNILSQQQKDSGTFPSST